MHCSYKKLMKLLIDRDMKKQELTELAGISAASMAKLGGDKNVTVDILVKVCEALDCDFSDIMEIVHDEKDKKKKE